MHKIIISFFVITVIILQNLTSATALPVFLEQPFGLQTSELMVSSANYSEEQNIIDVMIGGGTDAYGLAKWLWGLMATITGALMFGSFKLITWHEHRKYDRAKSERAKPDRTSRFVADASQTTSRANSVPGSKSTARQIGVNGKPVFGRR